MVPPNTGGVLAVLLPKIDVVAGVPKTEAGALDPKIDCVLVVGVLNIDD